MEKFLGFQENGGERSESFDLTLDVKKGDTLVFTVNSEGNDDYDGGRFEVAIATVS